MKTSWIDFCCGMVIGAFLMLMLTVLSFNALNAEAIKAHQEGKIECATVGGEFVCREVRK